METWSCKGSFTTSNFTSGGEPRSYTSSWCVCVCVEYTLVYEILIVPTNMHEIYLLPQVLVSRRRHSWLVPGNSSLVPRRFLFLRAYTRVHVHVGHVSYCSHRKVPLLFRMNRADSPSVARPSSMKDPVAIPSSAASGVLNNPNLVEQSPLYKRMSIVTHFLIFLYATAFWVQVGVMPVSGQTSL